MRAIVRLGAVAAATAMSACSVVPGNSEYGCPGLPAGVVCTDTRAAYMATNNADRILSAKAAEAEGLQPAAGQVAGSAVGDGPAETAAQPVVSPQTFNEGVAMMPIRTPAVVMRVWVAPWVSDGGDLMMPGYVMTEIEPRRWQIGHEVSSPVPEMFLQSVPGAAAAVPATTASATTAQAPARPPAASPAAGGTHASPPSGAAPARPAASSGSARGGAADNTGGVIGQAPRTRGVASAPSATFVSPITGQVRTLVYSYPEGRP